MTSDAPASARRGVRLGSVLGVPVFIAPSWFLLAVLLVLLLSPPLVDSLGPVEAYAVTGSFAVLLGLSVLLHEIGHCVVARAFGLPVRSITVTFLAGFTEVTKPPETPAREYSVAVAGPMVSLLLAAVGVALIPVFDDGIAARLCENVALTNGLIAAVNLLPGLPLDGGRVLRSIVWRLAGDPEKATRAAAWAGRAVAVVVLPFVLVVLLPALGYGGSGVGNVLFAALLSAFIYVGATAALQRSRAVSRLPQVTVARLARPALRVPAEMPLAEAVRRAQEAGAHGLVVVDGADRLEAVVSEAAVLATPEQRRPWVAVGAVARRLEPGLVVDPRLGGEALLDVLRATPASEYVAQDPVTGEVRVLAASDVAKVLNG